jgi:hypothetical protein
VTGAQRGDRLLICESPPVVGDLEHQHVTVPTERDLYACSPSVLDRIAEQLAGQGCDEPLVAPRSSLLSRDFDAGAATARRSRGDGLERSRQLCVIEQIGIKLLDRAPEEINRRLIAPLARWHFCPTERSAFNLHAEGVAASKILVTGNTVIDQLGPYSSCATRPNGRGSRGRVRETWRSSARQAQWVGSTRSP